MRDYSFFPAKRHEAYLFEIETPLGKRIHTTRNYWTVISTIKHPSLRSRLKEVQETLRSPHEIRRSRTDTRIFLYYRRSRRGLFLAVVARHQNNEGFIITAYETKKILEGERIWPKRNAT